MTCVAQLERRHCMRYVTLTDFHTLGLAFLRRLNIVLQGIFHLLHQFHVVAALLDVTLDGRGSVVTVVFPRASFIRLISLQVSVNSSVKLVLEQVVNQCLIERRSLDFLLRVRDRGGTGRFDRC